MIAKSSLRKIEKGLEKMSLEDRGAKEESDAEGEASRSWREAFLGPNLLKVVEEHQRSLVEKALSGEGEIEAEESS